MVGSIGDQLLNFFYSGIQLYVRLSLNLCFISFLYLEFYVPGGNTSIS